MIEGRKIGLYQNVSVVRGNVGLAGGMHLVNKQLTRESGGDRGKEGGKERDNSAAFYGASDTTSHKGSSIFHWLVNIIECLEMILTRSVACA